MLAVIQFPVFRQDSTFSLQSFVEGCVWKRRNDGKPGQVNAGFNWSLATFGRIKTAKANSNIAGLEVERHLDQVQSSVVASQQTALTNKRTIPFAQQGVTAAEEALRLTQKNLEAGTGLTLDVLTAQDAADQARLNYASSVVRYNQAEINLLAALGLLEETNLEPIGRRAMARRR